MQTSPIPPSRFRRRLRVAVSCGECRRRKQKCTRAKDGPCRNCLRRYPPVECIFKFDSRSCSSGPRGESVKLSARYEFVEGISSRAASSNQSSPEMGIPSNRVASHHASPNSSESEICAVPGNISIPNSSSTTQMCRKARFDTGTASTPSTERLEPQLLELCSRVGSPNQMPRPANSEQFGVILSNINSTNDSTVNTSIRNAELLHFFDHFVVPNLCTADGSQAPVFFFEKILPWMVPNMAILMASSTRSAEHGYQFGKPSETLCIKSNVSYITNDLIKQDFDLEATETLPAVLHLIIAEWWWGDTTSLWVHLRGAKKMVKLQGGLDSLRDPVLRQVLILLDYELACCFERGLYLQDPDLANKTDISLAFDHPAALRSPLLAYPTTFLHDRGYLDLSPNAADILDDVQLLTLSITSNSSSSSFSKIKNIASLLLKRIEEMGPFIITPTTSEIDLITDTIRIAAHIYALSITSRTRVSHIWTTFLREQFFSDISAVSLSRWNQIPGIFFWVLLVACPGSGDDVIGKWLKRKMAIAGLAIGLENFDFASSCLRQFWVVQKWIESESINGEDIDQIL